MHAPATVRVHSPHCVPCFVCVLSVCCRYQRHDAFDYNEDIWEKRLERIAKRYLRTWFSFDLLSIAPSAFDYITVVEHMSGLNKKSRAQGGRMLRVLRVLRVLKLARLVRSSRLVRRLLSKVTIPQRVLQLLSLLFIVIITAHLFACTFGMIASVLSDDKLGTWLATYGLCWPTELGLSNHAVLTDSAECVLSTRDHLGRSCSR